MEKLDMIRMCKTVYESGLFTLKLITQEKDADTYYKALYAKLELMYDLELISRGDFYNLVRKANEIRRGKTAR